MSSYGLKFKTNLMDLEGITLSEMNQTEKDKYYHLYVTTKKKKKYKKLVNITKKKQTHKCRQLGVTNWRR